MIEKRILVVSLLICLLLLTYCAKTKDQKPVQPGVTGELAQLQKFLDIPIYPNSELADITTPLRDSKIPDEPLQAQVTLTIDEYEKVPPFYEKELGMEFTVDTEDGKKYYELQFEKGDWLYIIFVGHNTFENRPCFSIERWEK